MSVQCIPLIESLTRVDAYTMSVTCATCLFWYAMDVSTEHPMWGQCDVTATDEHNRPYNAYGLPDILAMAMADDSAVLKTRRDFACNQWEAKE